MYFFRESGLTSIEGSCPRRRLHGIAKATPECTRHAHRLLHLAGRSGTSDALQAEAAPPAQRDSQIPLHGHAIMHWATQRRCQWAGWSHPVPQPTARQSLHAPKHVWLIHRVCVTRALGSRAQVEAAALFGAPAVLLGLQGRIWCALCTGCAQEALQQRLR